MGIVDCKSYTVTTYEYFLGLRQTSELYERSRCQSSSFIMTDSKRESQPDSSTRQDLLPRAACFTSDRLRANSAIPEQTRTLVGDSLLMGVGGWSLVSQMYYLSHYATLDATLRYTLAILATYSPLISSRILCAFHSAHVILCSSTLPFSPHADNHGKFTRISPFRDLKSYK